jgi:hypothetical protein
MQPKILVTWKERNGSLIGIAHVIGPTGLEHRFAVAAPLKKIEAMCRAWAQKKEKELALRGSRVETAGFFSKIKRGFKKLGRKIAKSKILKTVRKIGRKIAKSKFVKGIVSVAAVVYPPIGAPAAAALAAANMTIDRVDAAKRAIKTAKRLGRKPPRKAVAELAKVQRIIKSAKKGVPRAKKMAKSLQIARRMQKNISKLAKRRPRPPSLRRRPAAPADAMRKLAMLKRRALMGDRTARQQLAGLKRLAQARRRRAA